MLQNLEKGIEEFKKRMETELEFCEELYRDATIKIMACKYAYYVAFNPYKEDYAYDILERSWFIMGRALGHLKEDETSPCIDFDPKHPLAQEGIELAKKLMRR